MSKKKLLVYGYGNPGRQDDGLGVLFMKHVKKGWKKHPSYELHTMENFQLNVEDALEIKDYDLVFFADASMEAINSFNILKLKPEKTIAFSTHAMAPESILALCDELYNNVPEAHIVSIQGASWEFNEPVSNIGLKNLDLALQSFFDIFKTPQGFS